MSVLNNLKIVEDGEKSKTVSATKTKVDSDDNLSQAIAEGALEVYKAVGGGFDSSIYKRVLAEEFEHRGLATKCNLSVPIDYRGKQIEGAFLVDFLVEDKILVVVRAEQETENHKLLLASCLKHSEASEGFLFNFYGVDMRKGIVKAVYKTGNVLTDQKTKNQKAVNQQAVNQ